jgi:hypothetical protein
MEDDRKPHQAEWAPEIQSWGSDEEEILDDVEYLTTDEWQGWLSEEIWDSYAVLCEHTGGVTLADWTDFVCDNAPIQDSGVPSREAWDIARSLASTPGTWLAFPDELGRIRDTESVAAFLGSQGISISSLNTDSISGLALPLF